MQINVDKEDIINMIKGGGTHGSYSWLNWLESNGYARYYDQYGKMNWNEEKRCKYICLRIGVKAYPFYFLLYSNRI